GAVVPDARARPVARDRTVHKGHRARVLDAAAAEARGTVVAKERAVGDLQRPIVRNAGAAVCSMVEGDGAVGDLQRPIVRNAAAIAVVIYEVGGERTHADRHGAAIVEEAAATALSTRVARKDTVRA